MKDITAYKGVNVTLRDYQKETVAWMRLQEDVRVQSGGGVPGLDGYFWERRSFVDSTGDEYYYFPLGGHVLLNPPPTVSGGLLAEEMGLGKSEYETHSKVWCRNKLQCVSGSLSFLFLIFFPSTFLNLFLFVVFHSHFRVKKLSRS